MDNALSHLARMCESGLTHTGACGLTHTGRGGVTHTTSGATDDAVLKASSEDNGSCRQGSGGRSGRHKSNSTPIHY